MPTEYWIFTRRQWRSGELGIALYRLTINKEYLEKLRAHRECRGSGEENVSVRGKESDRNWWVHLLDEGPKTTESWRVETTTLCRIIKIIVLFELSRSSLLPCQLPLSFSNSASTSQDVPQLCAMALLTFSMSQSVTWVRHERRAIITSIQ